MDSNDESSSLIFVVIGAAVVFWLSSKSERLEPNLKHIPTFGHSGYLRSYIDALRFAFNGPTIIQSGYELYRSAIYKVATLHRWLVVVNGTKFMEDLRKAPEDEISFVEVPSELDVGSHLSGYLHSNSALDEVYNITRDITQHLPFLIPEIVNEMRSLTLASSAEGWKQMDINDLVSQLTTPTVNRIFIGLSLARDKEYSHLTALSRIEKSGLKSQLLFSLLPLFISRILIVNNAAKIRCYMEKILLSVVNEKRKAPPSQEAAEEQSKFDGILFRLLSNETSAAKVEDMSTNVLNLSLSANHAISSTLETLLYDLVMHPKYATPMREETRSIALREGWTRHSVDKMHKLDSFIKESIRLHGTPSLSTVRKTLKDFTFSDGTCIPANTYLATTASPRHHDNSFYPEPNTFNGFRFSDLHEEFHGNKSSEGGVRFHLSTTTPEYLAWGYGRHACPGRFFAAVMLKVVLGHVLLHYDVRLQDGVMPQPEQMAQSPSETKLLIRKR